LTSSGWERPYFGTLTQRERARRSRLVSWLVLGLLVGVAILSPLALQDARARLTLAMWTVGILGAAALNRRGWVTLAGIVLVVLISGGLLFANLASPLGLTLGELPNFDAYVVSVVLAATVLPRAATFLVAAGNSLLIVGNYLLQPHNANIAQDARLYSSATVQTISFLVRPIALQLVLAVVAYLWVRGTDQEIRRADRAEEIAILEQRELERSRGEAERTFALEEGMRYLRQTVARWAQGDIRRLIPKMPVAILQQVSDDLNAFVARLGRVLQADYQLQRVQEECLRLADAIIAWRGGRVPLWPSPVGTPLDQVIQALIGPSEAPRVRWEHAGPWPNAASSSRPSESTGTIGSESPAPQSDSAPEYPAWLRPTSPSSGLPENLPWQAPNLSVGQDLQPGEEERASDGEFRPDSFRRDLRDGP
jgi:hypothetical protein